MRKTIIIALLVLSLLMVACTKTQQPQEKITQETPEETVELEQTGDTSVDAVGSDITEVDSIDDELDSSALEDLDKDLAELDW